MNDQNLKEDEKVKIVEESPTYGAGELKNQVTVSQSGAVQQVDRPADANQPILLKKLDFVVRRLIAFAIDQVICGALVGLLVISPALLAMYLTFGSTTMQGWKDLTVLGLAVCSIFAAALWHFVYCAKFESSKWQATPGKLICQLEVVDEKDKPLTYTGARKRIWLQSIILTAVATGGCLAYVGLAFLWPNKTLEQLAPIIPILACYLAALFTANGQTVFDIVSRRIVRRADSSGSRFRLKDMISVLFTKSNGKRDVWTTMVTACASVSALILVPIACTLPYSFGEARMAASESRGRKSLLSNRHLVNARANFREVGLLYYACAEFVPSADEKLDSLRLATLASPKLIAIHSGYGNALAQSGKYGEAIEQFKKALSLQESESSERGGGIFISPPACIGDNLEASELWVKLADCYLRSNKPAAALDAANRALALELSTQALKLRAQSHAALGNKIEAARDEAEASKSFEASFEGPAVPFKVRIPKK